MKPVVLLFEDVGGMPVIVPLSSVSAFCLDDEDRILLWEVGVTESPRVLLYRGGFVRLFADLKDACKVLEGELRV